MKLRDQLSNSEIARRTGLSRNTVKKWLQAAGDQAPKYQRGSGPTKLRPFEATLVPALEADARRPKHARRTARALFAQLQALGYRGGYSRLTDFIRAWRGAQAQTAAKAFVPLSFEFGEAFQFDWSEEGLLVGGVYHHMQVSHLKLCASRAFWLVAYPSQGHEMLFDAHTRSFAALGGVAHRGIYDLHVDGRGQGQEGQGPHRQCALQRDVQPLPV
jgi:transposase